MTPEKIERLRHLIGLWTKNTAQGAFNTGDEEMAFLAQELLDEHKEESSTSQYYVSFAYQHIYTTDHGFGGIPIKLVGYIDFDNTERMRDIAIDHLCKEFGVNRESIKVVILAWQKMG